ncbi:hypothetical protein G7Z17_g862 [Cylindrodendrum hubeiense]|uniref:Nudix hydrolase domain-containing protein n=1 Tax=Cylindrodendrum hubeiense TaxID=595255 RepID=A0A9P5HKP9_9HYPO|nr:hypothetical protein G7Z17_g862 [Cylindrodendrum hubeiense]
MAASFLSVNRQNRLDYTVGDLTILPDTDHYRVGVAIIRQHPSIPSRGPQVLVFKHQPWPTVSRNRWVLPYSHLGPNETIRQAVRRVIAETSGIDFDTILNESSILSVNEVQGGNNVQFNFVVSVDSSVRVHTDDLDWRWVNESELNGLVMVRMRETIKNAFLCLREKYDSENTPE